MLNLKMLFFTCLAGINIVASNDKAKECLEASAERDDRCDCNGEISFGDNDQIGERFDDQARASMELKLCRGPVSKAKNSND
ncbi:hypothetical protein HOK15_05670 [Candidatus Falkowbacteria bacterium]|nr:hypothetical protein [Candidatus Falkowbacteria bacterium]